MSAIGGNTAGPGDAVVNVYINYEKKFAFVEMRSVEEASNAMALDGIIFEGAPCKVRRPSDYNPSLAATLGPSQPNPNLNLAAVGLSPGSAGGLEGPDRIFVGGLPYYFTEAQIRELLESFGALRGFDLVKDRETGNSKGYAFCVYQDVSVTDIACAALNGIKMGDKTLTVRRANQGTTQPKPEQESVLLHAQQQIALQRFMLQPGALATKVLCLTQVVEVDELSNDEDYQDILEDMRTECGKFGPLVNVVIPRPSPDGEHAPGVGKVFLEYGDVESASKARQSLNGRKFGGNQVVAVFYPENKFYEGDYDGLIVLNMKTLVLVNSVTIDANTDSGFHTILFLLVKILEYSCLSILETTLQWIVSCSYYPHSGHPTITVEILVCAIYNILIPAQAYLHKC
ncbi:hypothetical protein MTR67_008145 [Solanum verrucosum]|uniref:Splicing factor U2af large subunit n=1 Tax=Solanum verrucosum TaxID=315347 RepID=A0AAF0Q4M9_SOLVR|nr:hypothetical protein MTR67_008145 [Solanum verrucosum]